MPNDNIVQCPWCAEDILAEAKKCKHCGELFNGSAGGTDLDPIEPVWKRGTLGWRCIAHNSNRCKPCNLKATCPPAHNGKTGELYPSTTGSRATKLSEVGKTASGELRCPRCGGAQFTAKRSGAGKVIGFATLGVGGLIAPKSQVKCVTCGAMFKRG